MTLCTGHVTYVFWHRFLNVLLRIRMQYTPALWSGYMSYPAIHYKHDWVCRGKLLQERDWLYRLRECRLHSYASLSSFLLGQQVHQYFLTTYPNVQTSNSWNSKYFIWMEPLVDDISLFVCTISKKAYILRTACYQFYNVTCHTTSHGTVRLMPYIYVRARRHNLFEIMYHTSLHETFTINAKRPTYEVLWLKSLLTQAGGS